MIDHEARAAQIWCEPQHSHKEMDVAFAESIAAYGRAVEREVWEQAARLGQEIIDAYPDSVFIEPPKGQHGETIDACSARAGRHLGKIFRDRCREQGA